jgi:hypothetical protein
MPCLSLNPPNNVQLPAIAATSIPETATFLGKRTGKQPFNVTYRYQPVVHRIDRGLRDRQ